MRDTIFALASARGRAGVSVLRVSGPKAWAACRALCGDVPTPRRAALRNILWLGELIDQALVIAFAEKASFTGEQSVEFQLHGSQAVLSAVLSALGSLEDGKVPSASIITSAGVKNIPGKLMK